MKVNCDLRVQAFIYDVTIDGGAPGVYFSGSSVPLNALLLFCQYKVVIPFLGGAGALLTMGITGNTNIFTKGAPIDPTILPLNVWQDGGFSGANVDPASTIFTTISINTFTQGRLICTCPLIYSPE